MHRGNPYEAGTSHYYHDYIIGKYTYKGYGIERETRHLLKQYDDFSQWIDTDKSMDKVSVINAGRGQFSLLYALVHPETQVFSYANDPDDVALAAACEPMPANLHVAYADGEIKETSDGMIINLNEIVKTNNNE